MLPLKLLMTADVVGGVWPYALDLAAGLVPLGVATRLALLGPPPDAGQRAAAALVPGLELQETGLPLDWTAAEPRSLREAGQTILRLAGDADLLQANTPALLAEAPPPGPTLAVCHSCLATWWAALRGTALPPDFLWRSRMHAEGLAAAGAVVAPSAAYAASVAAAYGIAAPRVVHNGRRAPPAVAAGVRTGVLAAGRLWDEAKNMATLDRAAALLEAPIAVAGPAEGPNGARLATRHLELLGPLSEASLRRRLAGTAVFVSLSRYEPFGLAVLEAAQAGCALLLSDTPGFRELWEDAAVFVEPQDERAVAAALRHLLDDAGLRDRLARAARHRAARYSVDAMAAQYRALYDELLRGRPAERAA